MDSCKHEETKSFPSSTFAVEANDSAGDYSENSNICKTEMQTNTDPIISIACSNKSLDSNQTKKEIKIHD